MAMQIRTEIAVVLAEIGYKPGFLMDVKAGDEIVMPNPENDEPDLWFTVSRTCRDNYITGFIATDPDGVVQHHFAGHNYPVWIKEGS